MRPAYWACGLASAFLFGLVVFSFNGVHRRAQSTSQRPGNRSRQELVLQSSSEQAKQEAENSLRHGVEAFDKQDFDLAISCFTETIRLDPSDAGGYFGRGRALLHEDRSKEAIADFTEALKRHPDLKAPSGGILRAANFDTSPQRQRGTIPRWRCGLVEINPCGVYIRPAIAVLYNSGD